MCMAPIENSEGHGYMADHRPGPAASIKLNLKTNRLGRPYRAVADHNHRPDIHKLQTDLRAWNIYETYIKLEQVNCAKVKYSDYEYA